MLPFSLSRNKKKEPDISKRDLNFPKMFLLIKDLYPHKTISKIGFNKGVAIN